MNSDDQEHCSLFKTDSNDLVRRFNDQGYVTIDNLLPKNQLDDLHCQAITQFDSILDYIKSNTLPFGIGIKHGFKEIVQRHENRFEMPFKIDPEQLDSILQNPLISETLIGIFDEYKVISTSLVISLPGSVDQAWHVDGPHQSTSSYQTCHCLNIFFPLVDIIKELGPTEFRPCSQYLTRDMKKLFLKALLTKKLHPIEGPCLNKGDVLIVSQRFN